MNIWLIFSILVGLLLVGFLVYMIVARKQGKLPAESNYRSMFIIGIAWLPVGIATQNPGLWGVGLVFMIAGLANKDKWKDEKRWADLSEEERKIKYIVLGLVTLLLVGMVAYFLVRG